MRNEQQLFKQLQSKEFSRDRCKECKHFVASKNNTEYCGLKYFSLPECSILSEVFNLKENRNECTTNP